MKEKLKKVFTTITGLLTPVALILTVVKPDWFSVDEMPVLIGAIDTILVSILVIVTTLGSKGELSKDNLW